MAHTASGRTALPSPSRLLHVTEIQRLLLGSSSRDSSSVFLSEQLRADVPMSSLAQPAASRDVQHRRAHSRLTGICLPAIKLLRAFPSPPPPTSTNHRPKSAVFNILSDANSTVKMENSITLRAVNAAKHIPHSSRGEESSLPPASPLSSRSFPPFSSAPVHPAPSLQPKQLHLQGSNSQN